VSEPETQTASGTTPQPDRKESPRGRALSALRHVLKEADPGTLSRLRRMDSKSPPPDFFRVTAGVLEDVLPQGGPWRDQAESRWAILVQAMATALGTSPETGGLLGTEPFGEALAQAQVAELRVLRLLETEDDQLGDLVRQAVHQLVSKGQSFGIYQLADLVLDRDPRDPERRERARRRIARSFYRPQDR